MDIQTILENIENLPENKESFIANLMAHEKTLKADVESLEKA